MPTAAEMSSVSSAVTPRQASSASGSRMTGVVVAGCRHAVTSRSLSRVGLTSAGGLADDSVLRLASRSGSGLGGHQLGMGADRGDPAVDQQRDPVGELNGRRPVRDDERGGAGQHRSQRPLHLSLGVDVQGRQRIVEHQHRRPADHGAGQGQPLSLTAGQRQALLADPGVQTPGQVHARSRPAPPAAPGCTSSSVPSGRPSSTFSRTDAENSVGSSKATAICPRRSARSRSRMSTPSSRIEPSVTSYSRLIRLVSVVLPDPVAPTRAMVSPGRTSRSIPRSRSLVVGRGVGEPELHAGELQATAGRRADRAWLLRRGDGQRRVHHLEVALGGAGRVVRHGQQPADGVDRPAQAEGDPEEGDQRAGGQLAVGDLLQAEEQGEPEGDLGQRDDHRPQLGDHPGLADLGGPQFAWPAPGIAG